MTPTRDNIETALNRGLYTLMSHGRWWRVRRNGATRRWKRSPERIYIPIKFGYRGYGAITEADFLPDGRLNPAVYRPFDQVPPECRA